MEISELLQSLTDHNETGKGFQIHLNSGNLDDKSNKNTDVEFGDLYFTGCQTLRNTTLLCFDNMSKKPIDHKPDGTSLYPIEINSEMFLEINNIEAVEEIQNKEDWFNYPSSRVINIYMLPENRNIDGHRNVVTVGFMD